MDIGPLYGYFPKGSKTRILVKLHPAEVAREVFKGTEIVVSTKGEQCLDGTIHHGKKNGMLGK